MKLASIGMMLAIMGLYVTSGWAREPAANPVFERGTGVNKPPANAPLAMTGEKGADHPARNEAPAIREPSGPLSPTDKVVARFMTLDTDTSGGVSFEEYMTMVRERAVTRYAAMDTNHDGEVTDTEYRAFWKSRMAHWYRLKR